MRRIFSVTLLGLLGLVAGCGKPSPTSASNDSTPSAPVVAAPDNRPDLERLQGVWKVVSYESDIPQPKSTGQETFAFKDDMLQITYPSGVIRQATFTLDPSQSPKHFNVTRYFPDGRAMLAPNPATKQNEPLVEPMIYKFDGTKLVIGWLHDNVPARPTEFKTKSRPISTTPGFPKMPVVSVYTLEKTSDPMPEFQPVKRGLSGWTAVPKPAP